MQPNTEQTPFEQLASVIPQLSLESIERLSQLLDDEKQRKREKAEKLQADIERYKKTDRWLRENHDKYMGQWVCLYGDELVAHGTDGRLVHQQAKAAGIEAPLLEHIVEELPWGSW